MDEIVALSLHLTQNYLKKILPVTQLKEINLLFDQASQIVSANKKFVSYAAKIGEAAWGDSFSVPAPTHDVLKAVTEALFNNRRLWVTYRNRVHRNHDSGGSKYYINPLGLVYCSNIPYLLCTLWDSENIVHLALHRMSHPKIAPVDAVNINNFDLKEYIKSGAFNILQSQNEDQSPDIELKAIVSNDAATYFKERIKEDTQLAPLDDQKYILKCKVKDSWGLRCALRGFGEKITIIEPQYLREEIHKMGLYDRLTGMLNRGEFDIRLEYEILRHHRKKKPFTLLMMDIDHFKKFNDEFGHQDGDEVLKEVTQRTKASIREMDLLFRYGGEEFAVILPGSDVMTSKNVAERIKKSIAATPCYLPNRQVKKSVTVSIGLADYDYKSKKCNTKHLIEQADEMLYQAKKDGRNCVRCNSFDPKLG